MILKKYKYPILFYALSISIPWALWFIAGYISHNAHDVRQSVLLISFLGLLAPVLVSLLLILPDKDLKHDFLNRFFRFKSIKPKYLFITSLLMLSSIILSQLISLLFGYNISQFHITGSYSFTSGVLPVWVLLFIAPAIEELAWHSYGTDCLRARFDLFTTCIIFALFWGLWHFPLSFIKDYYHSNLVESGLIYSLNFILSLFPFVIIMNWLYYKTNRNILVAIIFHITAGYFNEIFATHPMSKVIQTALLTLFSIFLLFKEKNLFFGHNTSKYSSNL